MTIFEEARNYSREKHGNQRDKAGEYYHLHAERVAEKVDECGGNGHQIVAAYLHDVLEDTDADRDEMRVLFGPEVETFVDALTHRKGEPNGEYWQRIRACPGATLIKACDIYDNLDPARLIRLDEATRRRLLVKYGSALVVLFGEGSGDAH